jgi:uncharacterized protein (DUF1778 family)
MKKVMGRPKIGTENAKSAFITARFTPAEAKRIRAAIAASGLSKSDFVRKSLLNSADMVSVTQ